MTTHEQPGQPTGERLRDYHRKYKTGEIEKIAAMPPTALIPSKTVSNTVPTCGKSRTDRKPLTDKYGRAYTGLRSSEATPQAIAACVALYLATHDCYPVLIELSDERYITFGIHYRQYCPDIGATRIPIVACSRSHRAYDIICYGEARTQ